MKCIVVAGPKKGEVFEQYESFGYLNKVRLPTLKDIEYERDDKGILRLRIGDLYIVHELVCMRGNTAYYAPEGMSNFDIITQLLEQ